MNEKIKKLLEILEITKSPRGRKTIILQLQQVRRRERIKAGQERWYDRRGIPSPKERRNGMARTS